MTQPFNGTLFRFPLRTDQMAKQSELVSSPQGFGVQDVLMMFQKLMDMGSQILLNLRFVNSVKLYIWADKEEQPLEIYSASLDLAAMSQEASKKRSSLFLSLSQRLGQYSNSDAQSAFTRMMSDTKPNFFQSDIYDLKCVVKGKKPTTEQNGEKSTIDNVKEWTEFICHDHWKVSRAVGQGKSFHLAKQFSR